MAYLTRKQTVRFVAKGLRSLAARRVLTRRPFLLSHLITTACNAACPYCFWRSPQPDELSTGEVKALYRDAWREGFFINGIWGGEPLLRPDLAEVVRYSAEVGFFTAVFTNGYHLAERHEFAEQAHTLVLSLDDTDGRHDALRRCDGLFRRAIQGLEAVKNRYPHTYVVINCVLSRLNPGAAERIIRLGKDLRVPVLFGPAHHDARYAFPLMSDKLPDLSASAPALAAEYGIVRAYKERGYPIYTSYHLADYFIEGRDSYRCRWPRICFDVYSNGDVDNCLSGGFFANIRRRAFRDILRSRELKGFLARADRCRRACRWTDPLECSALYRFQWSSIMNLMGIYGDVLKSSSFTSQGGPVRMPPER